MNIKANSVQRGIWFELAKSEDKTIYNEGFCLSPKLRVNRKRFEEAFYSLLQKYPNLSIGFTMTSSGELLPEVRERGSSLFMNLKTSTLIEAKKLAQKLVKETRFEMEQGNLFRWFFIDCDDTNEEIIVCVFHHIVCDGSSIQNLIQNLYNEYDELNIDTNSTIEVAPVDEINNDRKNSTEYWEEYLGNWDDRKNSLPPEFLTGTISTKSVSLDIKEVTDMAVLYDVRRAPLYSSAVCKAIKCTFGIMEPLIGIPVAFNLKQSQNIIGQNSSLICVIGKQHKNINEELKQQSRDLVSGMVNVIPISEIIAAGNIQLHNQIEFNIPQIVLTIIPLSLRKVNCPDWGLFSWDYLLGGSRYPILVSVFEEENKVDICIQSHFTLNKSVKVIDKMLAYIVSYFKKYDEQLCESYNDLPINIYEKQEEKIEDTNLSRKRALEIYLKRKKGSICVKEDEIEYTTEFITSAVSYYQSLWESYSKKITTVAIKENRLWATVAAMLAAFFSGRRFVILSADENLTERDKFIVSNSKADIIISNSQYTSNIPSICIPDKFSVSDIEDIKATSELTPDAYLVYTSGTTGQPKGVRIGPETVIQLVSNTKDFILVSNPRVYQFTEHTFDVFIQEVFTSVLVGGTLVSNSKISNKELPSLPEVLQAEKIDTIFFPYAALSALSSSRRDAANYISELDVVFVTGEQLIVTPDIRNLFILSRIRLVNMYGPSETHVCSFYELPRDPHIWEKEPSIGKPANGYKYGVISPSGLPVEIGVPGELIVKGRLTLNGYIDGKDTSVSNDESIYHTGDMVVADENGYYSFLGRNDDQLKISGHRVHLGAIEAMLSDISKMHIIISAIHKPNQIMLIGHYEGDLDKDNVSKLLELFRDKLPNYIVPKVLLQCSVFPKGRTGKIDRKSLYKKAQEYIEDISASEKHEMILDSEKYVKTIWENVLGITVQNTNSSLFDLGGTSLDALHIYGEIAKEYSVDFSALMKIPTISAMSSLIESPINKIERIDLEKYLDKYVVPKEVKSTPCMEEDITLITGSTGFLGAHLVDELVSNGRKVRAIVRGDSQNEARHRLKEKFDFYKLSWNDELIEVVPGDIISMNDISEFLSKPANRLIHAAAEINFVKSFEEISDSNVQGTYNILKMCSDIGLPVVYVSTTAVFSNSNTVKQVTEKNEPSNPKGLMFGYPQSKWIADRLAARFQSIGHSVGIVRAGRIGPSLRTGVMRADDFFLLQLRSVLRLGLIPESWLNSEKNIDLVPVDITARIITDQNFMKKHPVVHIVLNESISWNEILDKLGKLENIRIVTDEEWLDLLGKDELKELDALRTLIPLIKSGELEEAKYPIKTNFQDELEKIFGVKYQNSMDAIMLMFGEICD